MEKTWNLFYEVIKRLSVKVFGCKTVLGIAAGAYFMYAGEQALN